MRPHIVNLGNDGLLSAEGKYGTSRDDVRNIVQNDLPRIAGAWKTKRVLLYAHGGLVSATAAVQRVAEYREALLGAEVYPLAFIWHSDYWTTLGNILSEGLRQRRTEGFLDSAKDFMLDRLDDLLEPIARRLTGKAEWDEMKENAEGATKDGGGGLAVIDELTTLKRRAGFKDLEIHIVAHSAGSILMGSLVKRLTAERQPIATCTLWAPACTMDFFHQTYGAALDLPAGERRLGRVSLFTLTDEAEQDDNCAQIYHKSLLYLVSNAFEAQSRIPVLRPDGTAILGMEKFIARDQKLGALIKAGLVEWIKAPNPDAPGSDTASRATHHGDFDDDRPTVRATLARIVGRRTQPDAFRFHRSGRALRDRRMQLRF